MKLGRIKKHRTFSMTPEMGETHGVVYSASDWGKDDLRAAGPARILIDNLAAELDELNDGESITIEFTRYDMTKQIVDSLPEI